MLDARLIQAIIEQNTRIRDFWAGGAGGWPPADTQESLSAAQLDWQVSLSHALYLWNAPVSEHDRDARLILAWAHLGALVEGTLKWFLCVYCADYSKNPVRKKGANMKAGELMLFELSKFFRQEVWTPTQSDRWDPFLTKVRANRNVIHAFQRRQLADEQALADALEEYLEMIGVLDGQVPYP